MTAQRMITHERWSAVQEAMMILSAKTTLRRLVWICEICGMIHLEAAPAACACCGASKGLMLQQDTRQEISSRG
jgi:rubrerythrin